MEDVNTGTYPQLQHNVAIGDREFNAFKAELGL
jgi:3-methyl-2-oxobutanoate hydroxymethyltransferase